METVIEGRPKNREVIHKYLQKIFYHVGEDRHHTSLEGGRCIAKAKGHASVSKSAKGTCERRHLLVLRVNNNLVVSGVAIYEAVITLASQTL
jgi:hypothetical protein